MTTDAIEITRIAKDIETKIRLLEVGRDGLEKLARNKARSIAAYDKAVQISMLKLKGEGNLQATLIEKVAKGECHKERADMELADALYKIQIVKMNAVQAELNGFQSIFKHLEVRT